MTTTQDLARQSRTVKAAIDRAGLAAVPVRTSQVYDRDLGIVIRHTMFGVPAGQADRYADALADLGGDVRTTGSSVVSFTTGR
jgi:hypothetical protein